MTTENWKHFVLITFSGLIICMLIGFILAGYNAILPGHLAFQFTFYGLFCSLLYAVLRFSSTRDFIFVAIIFYLFDAILLGHGNPAKFVIHGIYSLFIAGSIYIYAKKIEQDIKNQFLSNILSLSGLVAFAFLFTVLVLTMFPKYKFDYSFLEGQVFMGLLIGLGLGVGFHVYYWYQSKIKKLNKKKA